MNGLIFVSLDPKYTFEQQFGDCIPELENIPNYRVHTKREHLLKCNWKLYVENYLEGYHIPFAHPKLAKDIVMSKYEVRSHERHISHHVRTKDGSVAEGFWMYLWPNLAINSYTQGFSIERILPISPTETKISYLYLFAPDSCLIDIENSIEASTQTTEEDIRLVEGVQKNLQSGMYIPGPLSPKHETGLCSFHDWLREEDLL